MKRLWCVLAAVTVVYSGGCSSTLSKNPDEYVGECVFKPYNSDTDGFADLVLLKRDLKAIEVRFHKKIGAGLDRGEALLRLKCSGWANRGRDR